MPSKLHLSVNNPTSLSRFPSLRQLITRPLHACLSNQPPVTFTNLKGVSSGFRCQAGLPRRLFLFSTDLPFLDLARLLSSGLFRSAVVTIPDVELGLRFRSKQ